MIKNNNTSILLQKIDRSLCTPLQFPSPSISQKKGAAAPYYFEKFFYFFRTRLVTILTDNGIIPNQRDDHGSRFAKRCSLRV
jgi:hypothetical protein